MAAVEAVIGDHDRNVHGIPDISFKLRCTIDGDLDDIVLCIKDTEEQVSLANSVDVYETGVLELLCNIAVITVS